MKRIFYLLIGLLFLGACSDELQEVPGESSPVVGGQCIRTEKVVNLSDWGICRPSGLLKRGQEVIVGDQMNRDNVYRINVADGTCDGMFPRIRTRSGGATILHSLASDGQGGWTVLETMSGKVSRVASVMTRAGAEETLQLPEDHRHLWAISVGDRIVATGIYPEGRYLLYSPVTGSTWYGVGYPEHPLYPELEERAKAVLYASNVLRARPDGLAFVCADMYSGLLDICRIEEEKICLVKRLAYHYPRVVFREQGEWPRVLYSKDNRFGFTDVCVTNDGIYALYSGLTYRMEKEHFQYCRTLIEIDWEGEVRNTRSVDAALTHLTYDAQENTLYGIAWNPGATLVKLNFD